MTPTGVEYGYTVVGETPELFTVEVKSSKDEAPIRLNGRKRNGGRTDLLLLAAAPEVAAAYEVARPVVQAGASAAAKGSRTFARQASGALDALLDALTSKKKKGRR